MPIALPPACDVAIVGAGTAGAAAAARCAARGLRVVCVDRGRLDDAGARWVNGVPASAFDAAGLSRPAGDELRHDAMPVHLVAGWDGPRVRVDGHEVLEVDMRLLVARLQRLATEHGAVLLGGVRALAVDAQGLVTDHGTIAARWIVDASGVPGLHLLEQPRPAPRDLCAAAQEVRRLRDPAAARAYFDAHGVPPGEVLCFTGIAGGYSVLNVRITADTVGLLTGSIPADGHASGRAVLDDFVAAQPWIGERLFGGHRAIPLHRPHDRLTDDRIILLGDAAGQVFPAHGSGIGAQLIAAETLAAALAETGSAWRYAQRWMRAHGGLFAGYDLFRRFSQSLAPGEVVQLFGSGLLDPVLARAGMDQRTPRPTLASLPAKLRALASAPRLAARMSGVVARMLAVRAVYARYPSSARALPRWSRAAAAAAG